jgi:hypothetical protein
MKGKGREGLTERGRKREVDSRKEETQREVYHIKYNTYKSGGISGEASGSFRGIR